MALNGCAVDGQHWIEGRKDFFLPVQVLSRLFRGKMLAYLKKAYQAGELIFPGIIAPWQDNRFFQQQLTVLYQVEGDQVTFRYRDSPDHNHLKEMTLEAVEFIRRFLLHVLPDHFVKIRHYGLLSNRHRKARVRACKGLLERVPSVAKDPVPRSTWQEIMERLTGIDPMRCPHCGKGKMVTRQILLPWEDRSPPGRRVQGSGENRREGLN